MKKNIIVTVLICTVFTVINLSARTSASEGAWWTETQIRAFALDEAKNYINEHVTRSLDNGGNTKILVTEDDGSVRVLNKICVTNGADRMKVIEPFSESVSNGCY